MPKKIRLELSKTTAQFISHIVSEWGHYYEHDDEVSMSGEFQTAVKEACNE